MLPRSYARYRACQALLFGTGCCTLEERIGFPRGFLGTDQEVGQGESVIKALGGRLQLQTGIRFLNLHNPRTAHRLDSEPARLPRFPVVVAAHAAMSDKGRKAMENIALHRSQMLHPFPTSLTAWSRPLFHGTTSSGDAGHNNTRIGESRTSATGRHPRNGTYRKVSIMQPHLTSTCLLCDQLNILARGRLFSGSNRLRKIVVI